MALYFQHVRNPMTTSIPFVPTASMPKTLIFVLSILVLQRKGSAPQPKTTPPEKQTPESPSTASPSASESYRLYEGPVRHHRVHPISHFFQYRVRYALINLDSCPGWFQKLSAALHMSAEEARAYAGTKGAMYPLTRVESLPACLVVDSSNFSLLPFEVLGRALVYSQTCCLSVALSLLSRCSIHTSV